MRGVHRRVTGFCAVEGREFAQKAGGARVFAIVDQNGAAIAGFGSLSWIVKIRRTPCGAWNLGVGDGTKVEPLRPKTGRLFLNTKG
jgi:hypothetical protein